MTQAGPEEVRIRPVLPEDLPTFFEQQRDPEATRMADFPARERDAFMVHWGKILNDATNLTRTILADAEVAGNVVCWSQGDETLVGYWLGREYWGRGIATRALRDFLGIVAPRPLYAHVAKHNCGSIRVLEKCGFALCAENEGDFVFRLS